MPRYDYFCEQNQQTIEVTHSIHETLFTWGEVCEKAGLPAGDTPVKTPVIRLISRTHMNVPISNSRLKEMGFTKLVRREKGVYENVTASGEEKKFVTAGDSSSLPHFHKKIPD